MDLAKNDRKTFCTLLAKIIPTNIQADIGVDGEIRIVRKVIKGIAE
jgi:hypothetical protein